ncbi:UNVERIFIED_CONTAM: methyl-accepting chemotaxis protein [Acetivibrio alkalicellulosi]
MIGDIFIKLSKKIRNKKLDNSKNSNNSKKIETILNILRKNKVKFRLLLAFFVLSIVPLVLLGAFSYFLSKDTIDTQIIMYSNEIIDQSEGNITNEIDKFRASMLEITISHVIQENLRVLSDPTNTDNIRAEREITDFLISRLSTMNGVEFGSLLVEGYSPIDYRRQSGLNSEEIINDLKKLAEKGNGSTIIGTIDRDNLFYLVSARVIRDYRTNQKLGYFFLGIESQNISNLYKDIYLGDEADLFILNSEGKIVSNKNLRGLGNSYDEELFSKLNLEVDKFTINYDDHLYTYKKIEHTDWILVGKVPFAYINSGPNKIRNSMIFFILICIIFSILLSLGISMSIAKPLSNMEKLINEAKIGNLTINIEDDNKDEIADVIRGFNHMIGNIRKLIEQVRNSSQKVIKNSQLVNTSAEQSRIASKQISEVIQQVAIGAVDQAENISNCAQSINLLSEDINQVEDNISLVEKVAKDTKFLSQEALLVMKTLNDKALKTSSASQHMITDINELSKSMGHIVKIVKTMSQIADQTNLLSLNASIEAAKAGEAGRGFSVVANEVKKLAEQSKNSSKEIRNIINNILEKTDSTKEVAYNTNNIISEQMEIVTKTDDSFKAINNSMVNLIDCVNTVSNLIKEVHKSKENASESIQNISAVSQETASISEEVSATTQEQASTSEELSNLSHELNDMAKLLSDSISVFKIK